MLRTLTFLVSFALTGLAAAQAPRLVPRQGDAGSNKPLPLEKAGVAVHFLADVAETVLDLEFRNPQDRALEAEFVLPLPEGAVVSGYALEINGSMREAVATEKARARYAYETIKRRMIDPGIIEREAGNIYRTRVYPVPANGTKRLRITYTETLPATPTGFAYFLPLDFPSPPAGFSCRLHCPPEQRLDLTETPGLSFAADPSGGLSATLAAAKPPAALKLTLQLQPEPALLVDESSGAFLLSVPPTAEKPRPRPAPTAVTLVWDASLAGLGRDHSAALVLLDQWFATFRDTPVTLHLLRDRLTDHGRFTIRDGRWQDLRKAIEAIDYDGAADLTNLPSPAGAGQVTVLVSQGPALLGGTPSPQATPWIVLHPGTADTGLGYLAEASGGVTVDLTKEPSAAALARIRQLPPRLISIDGLLAATPTFGQGVGAAISSGHPHSVLPWAHPAPGHPLQVFGTFAGVRPETVKLNFGFGGEITRTLSLKPTVITAPAGMIRRLGACHELALLEQRIPASPARIIEHCKQHQLVSEFTSLIVLERIEDYIEHRIPPPAAEAELLAEYDRQVTAAGSRTPLAWAWAQKLAWLGRTFPGVEPVLLDRLSQVDIWRKAIEAQFVPAQRDGAAFATITEWFEQTKRTIQQKPEIKTKADAAAWQLKLRDLTQQGTRLTETPLHRPPPGQPLAVSVCGMVANPGVITGQTPLTLRQAIAKAGGPTPLGSLDAVALYRNSGKTIYNTLSLFYQDVSLYPGDMIVVLGPYQIESGGGFGAEPFAADPFAAEPYTPRDPAKEPAIRMQANSPITVRPPAPSAGGGGDGTPIQPGIAAPQAAPEVPPADWAAFSRALDAGEAPAAAYHTLTHNRRQPPGVYQNAARMLFGRNHPELARRVLSNLVAVRPRDDSGLFTYALWLAEFGQHDAAEVILHRLLEAEPADLRVRLTLASMRVLTNRAPAAIEVMEPLPQHLLATQDLRLATIALTEFNGLFATRKAAFPTLPSGVSYENLRRNLGADIRITITSAESEPFTCQVVEPAGTTCFTGSAPTTCGGNLSAGGGISEYMIREAIPGSYRVACRVSHPTTVRVVLHSDWGRPNQQTRVLTRWLEPGDLETIAELDFEGQP